MPYLQIQTVDPQCRRKTDWHRMRMDSLIINDTHDLHWSLTLSESRRLLTILFPDHELFHNSVHPLPATFPPMEMNRVLESLRKNSYYGKQRQKGKAANKNANSDCWNGVSEAVGNESKMIKFLNDVMDAVEEVIGGKFQAKQLVIFSCIFRSLH